MHQEVLHGFHFKKITFGNFTGDRMTHFNISVVVNAAEIIIYRQGLLLQIWFHNSPQLFYNFLKLQKPLVLKLIFSNMLKDYVWSLQEVCSFTDFLKEIFWDDQHCFFFSVFFSERFFKQILLLGSSITGRVVSFNFFNKLSLSNIRSIRLFAVHKTS